MTNNEQNATGVN